jgi:SAM-dependent methyltransferase
LSPNYSKRVVWLVSLEVGIERAITYRMESNDERAKHCLASSHDAGALRFIGDHEFDLVYPEWIQELSDRHWTPVDVARKAARLLVTGPGTRVLDIGCGPGKFCAIGASITEGHFTGVEQRGRLADIAKQVAQRRAPARVRIVHANITEVSFRDYDAFYIFNPFEENRIPSRRIDRDVELAPRLYTEYARYVESQLALAPLGTRVVTYHGEFQEIPAGYDCERTAFAGDLKLWIKNRRRQLRVEADEPQFAPEQRRRGGDDSGLAVA